MPEKKKCRLCGAEIFWAHTVATNSLIPIDVEPCQDGNIVIVDGKANVLHGDLFDPMLPGEKYKSHFSTCPDAKKHRKPKKKESDCG